MIEWQTRPATILWRDPQHGEPSKEGYCDGDIVEWPDPPVYAIDPVTKQCTNELQCFLVMGTNGFFAPVRRGSWLALPPIDRRPSAQARRARRGATALQNQGRRI